MSEARQASDRVPNALPSVAQLKFVPDSRLTKYLEAFYRPDEQPGLQRLFLYSDESIDNAPGPASLMRGATSSIPQQMARMERELQQRSNKPRVLAKRLQIERAGQPDPGIHLKMDVILDELTAAAVRGLMVVRPDYSIGAHHHVARDKVTSRDEYLKACKHLYEALLNDEAPRLRVESIELVQNTRKK